MSNSSSDDEPKTLETNSTSAARDYEKERESRIAGNNARLNSLGLIALSKSLTPKPVNRVKTRSSTPKSKRKRDVHINDEYHPDFDFDAGSSEDDDDFEDEDEDKKKTRPNRIGLRYNKVKNLKSKFGKKVSTSNSTDIPVVCGITSRNGKAHMDEEEALKQAIALSLDDPGDINGGSSQTASVKEDNSNTQRKRKLLTLDDLRNIAQRCNMLPAQEQS